MVNVAWVVEYPQEHYVDYGTSEEARAAYKSIELEDGEYKYLFMAFDDDTGTHDLDDIGLAYESREEA